MSVPTFRALDGAGDELPLSAMLDAVVADASPAAAGPDPRPRTVGVMVQSVDGHVTVDGRSGGLGGPEDRAVFRGLRARADALLVGPGTLNGERYSTTLDPPHREQRTAAGRSPEPLLATVTRGFALDATLPLLHEPLTRAVVYTEVAPSFAVDAERIEIVRTASATPRFALEDLGRRGVRLVNCEGGPRLLAALVAAGALDELLVTVSPLLVGGEDPLAMLHGELHRRDAGPLAMALRGVWRSGDVVFLHYHLKNGSPA